MRIWDDIALDFITGLTSSKGCTVIFVVVNQLSKYGQADFSSVSVVEVFITNVVKLHGLPQIIVSDRDKVFTSKFCQHLLQWMGTTLALSSAYDPQSNGQLEALNKCLEMYLWCFVSKHPKQWVELLPWAELWYNTSYQSSIQRTPFSVVYGRDPPSLSTYYANEDDPPAVLALFLQMN